MDIGLRTHAGLCGRSSNLDLNEAAPRQTDEARAEATRRGLVLTLDGKTCLLEVRSA